MARLDNKIAVITGGASGIGLATAQRFAQEGAQVVIAGRRQAELDRAVQAIGPRASAVAVDVARLDELDQLFAQVRARHGGLDIVVANAGTVEHALTETASAAHFDKTLQVNLRGTYFTVQKALPLMRPGGAIVLMGSALHRMGAPAHGTYAAAKAGLRSFARTLAAELRGRQIRINLLSPGPVDTPIMDLQFPDPGAKQRAFATLAALTPLGRVARPEEIAAAALFLASDDSSYCTAIDLVVDGGATGCGVASVQLDN